MAVSEKVDVSSINHGFFQVTMPKGKKLLAWSICIVIYFIAAIFFIVSLGIPDIPPTEDVTVIYEMDELADIEEVNLGNGWGDDEVGKFFAIEMDIVSGTLLHGYYEMDSDGENCSDYVDYPSNSLILSPVTSDDTFKFSWYDSLEEEASHNHRDCDSRYDDWYVEEGDRIKVFAVQIEDEYYMMSVGAEGNFPPERTDREDAQRIGLLICIVASAIMMFTTPTSLRYDIDTLRTRWGNLPFGHGKPGEIVDAEGPTRKVDKHDWILTPPSHETWSENAYMEDKDGKLIEEHPNNVGTPIPATLTLYSVNGILFVIFSIWLSSDLLARHNDFETRLAGEALRIVVVIFTVVWLILAFRKWRLSHSILDTPTSNVRSVAVGPAELVGQIRPSPSGTLRVEVGDDPDKTVEGVVLFKWKEEEYVCTKDSDGKESCSWETRRKEKGGAPFMLHDGTGGILVDPISWKKPIFGDSLVVWEWGKMRWTVDALCAGDPIYCLGRVEPRRGDFMPEEGCPTEISNANLIVKGETDIGTHAKLSRGTELSVVANLRSTTEAIIIPAIMLVFSAIPFLW